MEALAPITNTIMESQVCEFILFIQQSFFKTDNHGKVSEAFIMYQRFSTYDLFNFFYYILGFVPCVKIINFILG
jgi:hypothetical protein